MPVMIADAFVVLVLLKYLGFTKKLISPSFASSRVDIPEIVSNSSPSILQPSLSAISLKIINKRLPYHILLKQDHERLVVSIEPMPLYGVEKSKTIDYANQG